MPSLTAKERSAIYRKTNPEKARAAGRKSYWKHREKRLAVAKAKRTGDIKTLEMYKRYRETDGGIKAQRRSRLKRYGLTLQDYDEMLENQEGVCAICGDIETKKSVKYLSVDHDHDTGKVRGLLCHNCNRWLGILESPWAKKAYIYLGRG